MKPNKLSTLQGQPQQQADITDIAEMIQKLSNCNRPNTVKPYSEYDPQSIYPPPSQISANNLDNQSQKSKSNNFMNVWKRCGVSESKEQISFGSKYELNAKKVKKIEVEKIAINAQISVAQLREDQVSNKDSVLNIKQSMPLNTHLTNYKITDFFSARKLQQKIETYDFDRFQIRQQQKQQPLPQRLEKIHSFNYLQDQKPNNLVLNLIQKNNKKRKTIQELKQELNIIKIRKEQTKKKLHDTKQQEKQKFKLKLMQTNQRKIQFDKFKSQMRSYLSQQSIKKQILPKVDSKLRSLEEYKKKSSQKKGGNKKQIHTDEESIGNTCQQQNFNQNSYHIPDKRNYINQWMSKLEKFKQKVQNDTKYYEKLHFVKRKVQQVSEDIQIPILKNPLLKDYALLSVQFPFADATKASAEQFIEVNAFNTEALRAEILTVLKYPKLSSLNSKSSIQKQTINLFKLSKKLHNSANLYFLQTTVALQTGENSQFIVYGRQKNQDFENLVDVLNKYETFSEVMARFIARVCLIALEQIKVKVDIPLFLLPSNIYFTPKYDIKFANILMNSLFLHDEFKPYLKEQRFYYFVAPEAFSQKDYSNIAIWSLGILLYYIIYQKYPFEYDSEASFLKETFFIYNQLTFPSKPVINEKLKDFITICLTGKEKDLTQLQKHQFFHK